MNDEERYTNRQIERLLDQQTEVLKQHFDLGLAPVLAEVKKTNGRVTKLENWKEVIDRYKWLLLLLFGAGWAILLASISGAHFKLFG